MLGAGGSRPKHGHHHGHGHKHGHGRHGHSHGHGRRGGMNLSRDFPGVSRFFRRWGGFLCVTFIWFFCFLSFISIWYHVFLPFEMYATLGKQFLLVCFHVLVVLCLHTYARVTLADPGYVDPNWMPPLEEGGLIAEVSGPLQPREEISMDGNLSCTPAVMPLPDQQPTAETEARTDAADAARKEDMAERGDVDEGDKRPAGDKNYCNKCQSYRPDRAHHCSMCNRCVMRMDHHCPWVNNCVGHNNLKLFTLWLWYGTGVGVSFILFFGFRIVDIYKHRAEYTTHELAVTGGIIGINLWLGLLLTLNLCGMGFNMVYLALTNRTTIESMFSARTYRRPRRVSSRSERWKPRHTYDLGPFKNIQQVFGTSMLSWALPTMPETSGYHVPTNPKFTECEAGSADSGGDGDEEEEEHYLQGSGESSRRTHRATAGERHP